MDKKISVIVPSFNSKSTIERCIDSLINQTVLPYEIIIIVQEPDDGTIKIINKYIKKYCCIKLLKSEIGSGVSKNRNLGIDFASGDYICFLDSDDEFYDWTLEYLSKNIDEVSFTSGQFVNSGVENNTIVERTNYCSTYYSFESAKDNKKLLISPFFYTITAKLYSLSIIKKHSIYFDESLTRQEDLLFNLIYISYSKMFCVLKNPVYHVFIDNLDSLSRKYNKDYIQSLLCVREKALQRVNPNFHFLANEMILWISINYLPKDVKNIKLIGFSTFKNHVKIFYHRIYKNVKLSRRKYYVGNTRFLLNVGLWRLYAYLLKRRWK